MTSSDPIQRRVLAIYPVSRAFGYVVLESPAMLIEWGVKAIRTEKTNRTLVKLEELIDRYAPDVIVLEDCGSGSSNRCCRIGHLLGDIAGLGEGRRVRVSAVPRSGVRKFFSAAGAATKHEIARAIAKRLPELASLVPQLRKPWMSEGYHMAVFSAAALALTFYQTLASRRRRRRDTL
jgi:hypothetical protein